MAHENDYLRIDSPASMNETFQLLALSGTEEMSRLFSFSLKMISPQQDIDPRTVIGQRVSFSVAYRDKEGTRQRRYFNGYVSRFGAGSSETQQREYWAEVVPWLWFLTRTSDCRVFAEKRVPEIVDEVFGDCPFEHQLDWQADRQGYPVWDYCVQYRETDFNFISRLLEQEGIYYYFRHSVGGHVLVLCDQPSHYHNMNRQLIYEYSYAGGSAKHDAITSWLHDYQYSPGAFAHTDYNFAQHPPRANLHPDQPLLCPEGARGRAATFPLSAAHEIFDCPGEHDAKSVGQRRAERYLEENDVPADRAYGASAYEQLSPGLRFDLLFHKDPQKAEMENRAYALLSVSHAAHTGSEHQHAGYSNSFCCLPADVHFRPQRITRKPFIHGAQTAVVVGPKGSEIHTDSFGRVQLQFFWDRYGVRLQEKQEKPVWVRVGQIIAGKNWGAMFIPRVGQEVIVTFLEGDPDRPLVTGVVYNGDQKPPYELPDEKTKSCIKTNSSPGGEGYNELRFEDKARYEQIFVHAQRNMDTRVRADSMESVGDNRHLLVGGVEQGVNRGDQMEMVYRDKHLKIHHDHIEHIGNHMELRVGGIDEGQGNQDIVIEGGKQESIGGDDHLHVHRNRCEGIDGQQSLSVGGDQQERVGGRHALDAGGQIHLKAGADLILEAAGRITLKSGGSFIDINAGGVFITGPAVLINSGGSAGSGAGSSPAAAHDAKPAQPIEPTPADDHRSGHKSTPY